MLKEVLQLAIKLHGDQVRKYSGDPYWFHLVNVADLVTEYGGDQNQIYAALLHDTLEDTNISASELKEELIQLGSTQEDVEDILNLVIGLTDEYTKEDYPDLNRKARKDLEADRLGRETRRCQFIKCADLIDNSRDIAVWDPKFCKVYIKEKEKILESILNDSPDPIWLDAWNQCQSIKEEL